MKKVYIDMDGVLAKFDEQPNALERFIVESGFFQKLEPTTLVSKINELLDTDYRDNIHILSASPNIEADADKMIWLMKNMPKLKVENIHIIRGGNGADERKAIYANEDSLLLDDYSNNLLKWVEKGGKGIKIVSGNKSQGKKWIGDRLVID